MKLHPALYFYFLIIGVVWCSQSRCAEIRTPHYLISEANPAVTETTFSYPDKQQALPIQPKSPQWLFEHSDLIAYVEIVKVDKEIDPGNLKEQPIGVYPIFGEQYCEAKVLRVLKGLAELKGKAIGALKRKSRYHVKEGEKLVLYLEKNKDLYRTIDPFGGEHRLASALCNVNELKEDTQTGGIVAAILTKEKITDLKIHIIRGRQSAGMSVSGEAWSQHLLGIFPINEFDIAEVPLEDGSYTVLLKCNQSLYPHSRLVDGHYPYVIIKKGRWKPLYFDMSKIKTQN